MAVRGGRVLDEHRFVAADLGENAEAIGGERAAGFHEVDDRVGHAQGDHHFDRAGEVDDVAGDFVLGEIALGDVREAGGDARAGEVGGLLDVAVVGDAEREPAIADAELEPRRELRRPTLRPGRCR